MENGKCNHESNCETDTQAKTPKESQASFENWVRNQIFRISRQFPDRKIVYAMMLDLDDSTFTEEIFSQKYTGGQRIFRKYRKGIIKNNFEIPSEKIREEISLLHFWITFCKNTHQDTLLTYSLNELREFQRFLMPLSPIQDEPDEYSEYEESYSEERIDETPQEVDDKKSTSDKGTENDKQDSKASDDESNKKSPPKVNDKPDDIPNSIEIEYTENGNLVEIILSDELKEKVSHNISPQEAELEFNLPADEESVEIDYTETLDKNRNETNTIIALPDHLNNLTNREISPQPQELEFSIPRNEQTVSSQKEPENAQPDNDKEKENPRPDDPKKPSFTQSLFAGQPLSQKSQSSGIINIAGYHTPSSNLNRLQRSVSDSKSVIPQSITSSKNSASEKPKSDSTTTDSPPPEPKELSDDNQHPINIPPSIKPRSTAELSSTFTISYSDLKFNKLSFKKKSIHIA